MSQLEDELDFQIRIYKIPMPVREYRFHPQRKWRFDFCWPQKRVAMEVEGGIWVNGRHNRPTAFMADCEKYNTATLGGWRVFRVADSHIRSGAAVEWLRQALI